jgi:hypothetical protein
MDIENNKQGIFNVMEESSVSRLHGSNLIMETFLLLKFGNNCK